MLETDPYERSSTATTSKPLASNRSQTCDPTSPRRSGYADLFAVMPPPSLARGAARGSPARPAPRRRHRLPADDLRVDVGGRREREARNGEHVGQIPRAADGMHRLGDACALDDRGEDVLIAQVEDRLRCATNSRSISSAGRSWSRRRGIDVLRHVDEMAADLVRIDDVRRLDDGRQRNPAVGDVQVVVRADAPPRPQQEADDAEVAAVVGRRHRKELRRQQATSHGRRERAEDEVERPEAPSTARPAAPAPGATIFSTDAPAWISPPSSRIRARVHR